MGSKRASAWRIPIIDCIDVSVEATKKAVEIDLGDPQYGRSLTVQQAREVSWALMCAADVLSKRASKTKRRPRRDRTISVSKEFYEIASRAAKARGWSVRQLVEEATRGV